MIEDFGKENQKILYHHGLPGFLFYRRLTVLLFRRQFKVNKIKNFRSIGVRLIWICDYKKLK